MQPLNLGAIGKTEDEVRVRMQLKTGRCRRQVAKRGVVGDKLQLLSYTGG